jgi:hypothetical protein
LKEKNISTLDYEYLKIVDRSRYGSYPENFISLWDVALLGERGGIYNCLWDWRQHIRHGTEKSSGFCWWPPGWCAMALIDKPPGARYMAPYFLTIGLSLIS